jgi:hypothetical protein
MRNETARIRQFAIATAVLLCSITAHGADSPRQWYTLSIDGQRVGYAWREQRVERGEAKAVEHVRIEISQLRRRATVDRRVEVVRTVDGTPIRMNVTSEAGADQGSWRGEFDARLSRVAVFTAASGNKPVEVELPPDIQLHDRLLGALSPLWRGVDRSLTLHYFDVASARPMLLVAHVTSGPAENGIVEVETSTRDDRPHQEKLWFDAQGRLVRQEQPFFGAVLTWVPCERDCDRGVDRPYDPMARLVVRSPFHISTAAAKRTIRYVIASSEQSGPRLVKTPEQAVVRDGSRAVVTICDQCGAEAAPSPGDLESYLAPNAWVQSTHPNIVSFARHAAHGGTVDHQMNNLTQAVRARMTGPPDFVGYASALEAFRNRSGDCTEFAVLLAAVARAQNIPTRIVIGLVYADRFSGKKDVFSPHAWVQAWDGKRWKSYDAALDGFDSTRIGIAIGDGDPSQFDATFAQLPLWRIEKAGSVKSSN